MTGLGILGRGFATGSIELGSFLFHKRFVDGAMIVSGFEILKRCGK